MEKEKEVIISRYTSAGALETNVFWISSSKWKHIDKFKKNGLYCQDLLEKLQTQVDQGDQEEKQHQERKGKKPSRKVIDSKNDKMDQSDIDSDSESEDEFLDEIS